MYPCSSPGLAALAALGSLLLGQRAEASPAPDRRVLVTLLFEMIKRDCKKGLATLCIGGGQGVALAVERD